MNNRLGDLPAWAMEDSDSDDDDVPKPSKNGGDIEMQDQQNNHNHYMENFFKEVDISPDTAALTVYLRHSEFLPP